MGGTGRSASCRSSCHHRAVPWILPAVHAVCGKRASELMLRKIDFNGLSETISSKMLVAPVNVNVIDDYFNNNNNFLRDELRDRFSTYYAEAAQQSDNPDEIFMSIYNRALPKSPTKAHADAVMTLMAYYFECCDIFKTPEQ